MQMKTDFPCLQESALHPAVSQINPIHTHFCYLLKAYSNIIFPATFRFPE
jgi:hypothetical protein